MGMNVLHCLYGLIDGSEPQPFIVYYIENACQGQTL
jgi:hypothetical protein